MKRNVIAEVDEYRKRLRPSSARWLQVQGRLRALDAVAAALTQDSTMNELVRSEAAKYLPIGYVACAEAMTRLVIRDLIDRTTLGKKNLASFKDLKFGIEHIAEIHTGTLTLGEFVSHLLPCSHLDDIERYVSPLIGESLMKRIRTYEFALDGEPTLTLDSRNLAGQMFEGVRHTFELRHIFCHEVAPEFAVDLEGLLTACASCTLFVALLGLAVTDLCGE